jgi:PAS domain S-box-containing protein
VEEIKLRQLLAALPGSHLILNTDFQIVEVSNEYLRASRTQRGKIIGRQLFDVFPDNPNDPEANGVKNIRSSILRVVAERRTDSLPMQRYDIPNPTCEGGFEERWWQPVNSPIFNEDGQVAFILHSVEDVSSSAKLENIQKKKAEDLKKSAWQALEGGGEMGALMRACDFSKTPLGPVESWPQSLRTAVGIMLDNKFGMYVAWGKDYTQLYNDGYRPILGSTKHPKALGSSAALTFAESWHIIEPLFAQVMAGGTVGSEDWLLPLDRHGFLEDCYFTFSYSPIRIETGAVGGVLVTVSETTEHVRARKEIEENQKETQRLLEGIPQIVWTSRPDGSADFYNKRWYEYTGLNFEQTKGWGWQHLVHPADFDNTISTMRAAIETRTVWVHELRLLRGVDQEWRWHLVRWVPLIDSANTLSKWVGAATDIHDQKAAQAETVDILESMNEGFFSVDEKFRITRVNARHLELTKVPKDQQIGQYFFDVFPEAKNQNSTYWIEYHRAINERVVCSFEDYYAPLDLWTAVTVFPKATGGFAAFFRDITSDKLALKKIAAQAAELKTIQERFERSARATDLGVWYCDLPFDVLNWNAEVKNHFFLPPDAHVTIDTFYERMHPDDREKTRAAIDNSISSRGFYDTVFRTLPPGAESSQAAASSYAVKSIRAVGWTDYNLAGEPIRFDGITLDVTAILAREEELRISKEAAETANETKSAFLANMSHEIRTPLGAILGFSELLRNQNLGKQEREHYIDTISRNGKSLTRIIDDILDLAKVEAGRLEVEAINFSLSELLTEVIELFTEKARQKKIYLNFNIAENVPRQFFSDSTRLRQILINIVGNAVKFTDTGGVQVNVKAEPLDHDLVRIIIDVEDTGPGLTDDQKTRLFNPFTQADSTTTRRFGGTGLGLALSRRLTEALGGSLLITRTEVARGSTFSFNFVGKSALNKLTTQEKSADSTSSQIGNLGGYKVLLVDDSADNQFLLTRLLQRSGVVVDVADNGRRAVDQAAKATYDLVLMDIQMPVMDGYQALKALKANGFDAPVIALTAHAMNEEREKTKAAGFAGHLTKPVNSAELIAVISELLRASRD